MNWLFQENESRVSSLKTTMKRMIKNLTLVAILCGLAMTMTREVLALDFHNLPDWFPEFSSYLQVRFTDPDPGDSFWSIRRFKLMADGKIHQNVAYHFQAIYKTNLHSLTDDRICLQDAYFTISSSRRKLKIGQFVPPFGLERSQPDKNLDFVDRTEVTTRLVVNGNLGSSFARDRGIQYDHTSRHTGLSFGLFQGEGTNLKFKGNGPLGVFRFTYGSPAKSNSSGHLHGQAGLAASERRVRNLDWSGAFPDLPKSQLTHFRGSDLRANIFALAGWRSITGQGEFFLARLQGEQTPGFTAHGSYLQMAYHLPWHLIAGVRHEWIGYGSAIHSLTNYRAWTGALTYDFKKIPFRIAADCTWRQTSPLKPTVRQFRLQWQYILF